MSVLFSFVHNLGDNLHPVHLLIPEQTFLNYTKLNDHISNYVLLDTSGTTPKYLFKRIYSNILMIFFSFKLITYIF